jgi:hypothetical protein
MKVEYKNERRIFEKLQIFKFYTRSPFVIWVKIGPPHPHVCRKRRLIGAVFRMRPEKPRSRVTAGVTR